MPPGYKQTEVGVIPEDWDVTTLGEIGDCLIGLTYTPSNVKPDGLLVLRSSNIGSKGLKFEDNVFVDVDVPEKLLIRADDILICVRNGSRELVGKSALIDERAKGMTFGAFMSVFRSPHNRFVFYQFQSETVRQQIHARLGATINQITNKSLNSFHIPFPSQQEQRAIAAALSDVDALISSLDRLIAKKRAVKTAAMQQLLTGKQRLPGFGGEWEVRRLGKVIERIVGGGTPSRSNPAYWGDEVPWMTVKDFAEFDPHRTQESITREGLKHSASNLIPKGTVIISTRMALGKAVIYEVDVCINQDLKAVFPMRDISSRFLYFWFEHNAEIIESLGSGSTVKGISLQDLKNVEFLKPSLEEQTAIAAVLSDMDAEIAALEARRQKTRRIKQGMMQELLTGKTRLKDAEAGE